MDSFFVVNVEEFCMSPRGLKRPLEEVKLEKLTLKWIVVIRAMIVEIYQIMFCYFENDLSDTQVIYTYLTFCVV